MKDCNKRELLAIVVQYVNVDKAASVDDSSLSAFILDTLRKNDIDKQAKNNEHGETSDL